MSAAASADPIGGAAPTGAASPTRRRFRTAVAAWAGATVLMFALSFGGLALERGSSALVVGWPMNAVVLACLLRSRTSLWPCLFVSFVLSNLPAPMAHGKPLALSCAMALTNGVVTLAAAAALRRWLGGEIDLARSRHLWLFTLVAVVGLPGVTIILFNFAGADHRLLVNGLPRLTGWAVGNGLSYMVVTPALLICTRRRLVELKVHMSRRRLALLLATYAAAVLLLSLEPTGDARVLLPPALLWLTFRLGTTGAAAGLLIQAVIATACVWFGLGPAVGGKSAADALIHLQLGLVLNALCAYPVAAALSHRWRLARSVARSQATLEQAQKLAQMAEQIGGIGHVRFDVAMGRSVVSDNLARMLGVDMAGATAGLDLVGAIHPEDAMTQAVLKARAVATGEGYDTVLRVRGAAGDWRILRSRSICERGADGAVTGLIGVMVDITDLRLADEALRGSEARFRLLAEHANDMIIQTDREGQVTYVSPAIEQVIGYAPEAVMGRRPNDLIDAVHAAASAEGREAFRTDPENALQAFSYRARHKDGRELWLESRSSLMRDPDTGEVTGSMHVVRDVSARKAMEEALERKCKEAEAATVAKSEFLANMSHEIRTPLTGIIGFSDLLHRMDDLPETAAGYAKRIHTAGTALLTIVNDVLDFSKLDAGQLELSPHPFEPDRFLRETVELVAMQAEQKGLDLAIGFSGSVPAWVEADSQRLRQVLLNLLTNAIKFTDRGEVSVEAGYDAEAGRLRIAVRDTGCGIPADRQGRLFRRFSQVDSSISRSHGGTGLGLAICKHLTRLMGGAIEVESREGQGSVFRFAVLAPVVAAPQVVSAVGEVAEDEIRPIRMLVVDDVTANRELVRAMLTPFGHGFVEAENGLEAVEAARREPFDLILMDMQMPGMDGRAATRAIRAGGINADTPILALSANVLPADVAACRAAGMDDHISKPISPLELLTKVALWCDGRGMVEEMEASAS